MDTMPCRFVVTTSLLVQTIGDHAECGDAIRLLARTGLMATANTLGLAISSPLYVAFLRGCSVLRHSLRLLLLDVLFCCPLSIKSIRAVQSRTSRHEKLLLLLHRNGRLSMCHSKPNNDNVHHNANQKNEIKRNNGDGIWIDSG